MGWIIVPPRNDLCPGTLLIDIADKKMQRINIFKILPDTCKGAIKSEARVRKISDDIKAKYMRLLLEASLDAKDLVPVPPPDLPDDGDAYFDSTLYKSDSGKSLLCFDYDQDTQGIAYETSDYAIIVGLFDDHSVVCTKEVYYRMDDSSGDWPPDINYQSPESILLSMVMAISLFASS